MKRLWRWIKAFLLGECPYCKSLRIRPVPGWPKLECLDCGRNWRYGIL